MCQTWPNHFHARIIVLFLVAALPFLSGCGSAEGDHEASQSASESPGDTIATGDARTSETEERVSRSETAPTRPLPPPPPDLGSEPGSLPDFRPPPASLPEDGPIIDRIAPDRGPAEGGTLVRVRGENFTPDTSVELGGVPQLDVDVIDDFELFFLTESGPPGAQTLQIITPAGTTILRDAFTYEEGLSIGGLSPSSGGSAGGYFVRIEGEGFRPETRVIFGRREALETNFIDSRNIEALVPPGESGARVDVLLHDERFARRGQAFRYERSPRLVQLIPDRGRVDGGEIVRLDAVGFSTDCTLRFGNREVSVEEAADGALQVIAPGGAPGTVAVSWDCGAAGQGLLTEGWTWRSDATSSHTMWPRKGFTTGGELITIVLREGTQAESVFFATEPADIVSASGRFVQVLSPPVDEPAEVTLRIEEVGGAGDDVEGLFQYVRQPVFDRLVPFTSRLAGGVAIQVEGIGLESVDEVLVDDQGLAPELAESAALTFTAPRAPAGDALVKVRVGSLILSTNLYLTYRDELRFDAFTPRSGPTGGGTTLTVLGEGFDDACRIVVDGRVLETSRYGTSTLRAPLPFGDPGTVSVEVRACSGAPDHIFDERYRYADPAVFPGGVAGGEIAGELTVSVREFGSFNRVPDATVMVQTRSSSPYVAVTGDDGEVTFQGDDLFGPQTVTAWGEGRGVGSFVDVNARRVTIMLDSLPEPPCTPGEPGCDPPPPPPPPPPPGTVTGNLTGLDKVQALPPGTEPWGTVGTTLAFRGLPNPDPGPGSRRNSDGRFTITARLGDFALVAYCGYRDVLTGQFTARTMGVVRGLSLRPGEGPLEVDIDCNLPLNRELTLKLDNAPGLITTGQGTWAAFYRAELVYDLGTEGVIDRFGPFARATPLMTLGGLPPLQGPLAGVRVDITAGAYPTQGSLPSSVAYARGVGTYANVVRMPPLMPIPRFTVPAPTSDGELPRLRDGYVEWEYESATEDPDFFYLTVTADNAGFSRWSVFVPGAQRSFHLASFPTFSGVGGPAPPAGTLRFFVRAVRLDNFDYRAFDRGVLDTRRWRATSTSFETIPIRVSSVHQ